MCSRYSVCGEECGIASVRWDKVCRGRRCCPFSSSPFCSFWEAGVVLRCGRFLVPWLVGWLSVYLSTNWRWCYHLWPAWGYQKPWYSEALLAIFWFFIWRWYELHSLHCPGSLVKWYLPVGASRCCLLSPQGASPSSHPHVALLSLGGFWDCCRVADLLF